MSKQISSSTKTYQGEKHTMKIRNLVLALTAATLPLQAAQVGTTQLSLPVAVSVTNKFVGSFLARPALMYGQTSGNVASNTNVFTVYGTNNLTTIPGMSQPVSEVGTAELAPVSDNHYIVEFTSGPYVGLIKQITSFTSNTVTVLGNLPLIGDGTQFTIRKDHTIGSLFGDGTTNNPLAPCIAAGPSITSADIVSVLSSSGTWNQYFYQTAQSGKAGTGGWRLSANPDQTRSPYTAGTNRANVRVSLGTGFAFKTAAGTKNIFLNGEYRGTRERVTLDSSKGVVIANPYPVSTTLADLGVATSLRTNSVASFADKVNVLEGGKYVQFYNNGTGFVNSTNSSASGNGIVIPSGGAVLITAQTNREIVFAPQYIAK
jgi:hypothetical protein